MNQDKVTELLKRYPAFKHAVNAYERHRPIPSAGIANYTAMPSGSGAPERFFTIVGKAADMGHTSQKDYEDYITYQSAVIDIEGALYALTDEEQSVVKLKWMQDMTLKQIATRKTCSIDTIKRTHKSALGKLRDALRFTRLPDIEQHERAKEYAL